MRLCPRRAGAYDGAMCGREAQIAERATGVVARPSLFERLSAGAADGVTVLSAPAGSGKTVLLRSWLDDSGALARTAWVTVEYDERDAQAFWLAVVEQLHRATDGAVAELAPAVTFDGQLLVRRLIAELESLDEPVVLVIDDLHELVSLAARAQLQALLARRPQSLRVVLATRRDPQLGLHRLRLTGELAELRSADLRFTASEAQDLFAASGVTLSDDALATVMARTEGWAAGLRLVALSLVGREDPGSFVAAFSGSDRTVADYLLAEVLERQPEAVRRLLLLTSILPRVNGPLADRLTDSQGSERILLELEDANAFVIATNSERTWFRYHALFADLLRPRTAADRARGDLAPAPGRRPVVRRSRPHPRRHPPRAGRRGLGIRRAPARREWLQPLARRPGRCYRRPGRGLPHRDAHRSGARRLRRVLGSHPALAGCCRRLHRPGRATRPGTSSPNASIGSTRCSPRPDWRSHAGAGTLTRPSARLARCSNPTAPTQPPMLRWAATPGRWR